MRLHSIYKVTNLLNGKVYVGQSVRPSKRWYDHRRDSAKERPPLLIQRALKKYGSWNFTFEVIAVSQTQDDADATEVESIAQYNCVAPRGYNVSKGGGVVPVEANRLGAQKTNLIVWADPEFRKRKSARMSEQNRRLHAEGKITVPDWTGRQHRTETKEAIGKANSAHQIGIKNSRYNTVWVYSSVERVSRSVPKVELQSWLDRGWCKGRKFKW